MSQAAAGRRQTRASASQRGGGGGVVLSQLAAQRALSQDGSVSRFCPAGAKRSAVRKPSHSSESWQRDSAVEDAPTAGRRLRRKHLQPLRGAGSSFSGNKPGRGHQPLPSSPCSWEKPLKPINSARRSKHFKQNIKASLCWASTGSVC